MGNPLATHGMPVGYPCNEQEMNPIFESNSVDLREIGTGVFI